MKSLFYLIQTFNSNKFSFISQWLYVSTAGFFYAHVEAVSQRCSVKKVFMKISQNSQENTCQRVSFLIKLQAKACNFFKKETLAQVFSCEIFRIPFSVEQLWWLLLPMSIIYKPWHKLFLLIYNIKSLKQRILRIHPEGPLWSNLWCDDDSGAKTAGRIMLR